MKIKVIAIAPNDGWAFIVQEDKIFLLRPPYVASNQIEVTERDVENAMHLHGFEECNFDFNSLPEVIEFLKNEYIESMKNQGTGLPSSEQLRELLKYAPDDVLLRYLEKAENELIPEGKLNAAESIALELMKLDKVRENREMHDMAADILEKCNQKKREMEELAITKIEENQRATWEKRFPNAMDKYSVESIIRYKNIICGRGQLLPVHP